MNWLNILIIIIGVLLLAIGLCLLIIFSILIAEEVKRVKDKKE